MSIGSLLFMNVLIMIDTNMDQSVIPEIKETVKLYVNRRQYRLQGVLSFCIALGKSIWKLCSIQLWYSVALFLLLYCVGYAVYICMRYVGGSICFVLKSIIDVINDIAKFFKAKKVQSTGIDAMAALMDGTCDDFTSIGYTLRYWIARSMGNSLCHDMEWYRSITLTKYFVAEPLQFLYVSVGVTPGEICDLNSVWDMCAGVIGTMAWLDFMVEKGLWILLGFIVTAPLLKFIFKNIRNALHLLFGEIRFILFKSQPRVKKHKFASFVERCHFFIEHASLKRLFHLSPHSPEEKVAS